MFDLFCRYCDPTYSFPPQKDVIKYSVGKAAEFLSEFPNTMIAVGSYTIGKERIFRGKNLVHMYIGVDPGSPNFFYGKRQYPSMA